MADHVVAVQADAHDVTAPALHAERVPDTVRTGPDDVAARLAVRVETQTDRLAVELLYPLDGLVRGVSASLDLLPLVHIGGLVLVRGLVGGLVEDILGHGDRHRLLDGLLDGAPRRDLRRAP